MSDQSYGTITAEEVEAFGRSIRRLSPTEARQLLMDSGFLDSSGRPRWVLRKQETDEASGESKSK